MSEVLNLLYKMINTILDESLKQQNEKIQFYVKEIFIETEKIYKNFNDVLNLAYNKIQSGEMSVDEAVKYFNNERFPFKSSRAKIRGFMKHPYYQENDLLSWFNIGVIGVLKGGLHESTERLLRCDIRQNDILADTIVNIKGYHTIVDIIERYDRKSQNSLFYSDYFKHYMIDDKIEEEIKKNLLRDIERQVNKIDEYWQLVCDYYPKLII